MKMTEKLVIRADADIQMGTGHIMRCLALAQAWQDAGGEAIFAMSPKALALEARLKSEGMTVVNITVSPGSADDAVQTVDFAREAQASWIVVDGYHFTADYQRTIKETGLYLFFIDDYGHANRYLADIVLNQNAYAQLLLGTRYTLFRREFTQWKKWEKEIPSTARKLLVTLGGTDPDNVTLEVVQALQQIEGQDIEVVIVVGASYPYYAELQSAIGGSPFSTRLLSNVTDMPGLMAWADIGIAGGGATAWELAFMGLPSLILVLSDNQRAVAEWLDANQVAICLDGYGRSAEKIVQAVQQLSGPEIREQMSRRGRGIVDGEGCQRILERLKSVSLKLRPVCRNDCELLWKWANDPEVRMASFSSEPIPWGQHVEWFNRRIDDPNCLIYIALNSQNVPIGQVRYDIDSNDAIISISVDDQFRNQGYGSVIIKKSCEDLFCTTAVQAIHAYVKSSNETSARAFRKAGFKDINTKTIKGCQALHLVLRAEER
jgi:UDP-2,4-diacetamido-2,4,6-trideoxy-beta-L-altropyranose hydrolase